MIRIIQAGIKEKPPVEAGICPVCGQENCSYIFAAKSLIAGREAMLRNVCGVPNEPPQVPTFRCKKCNTIWQWTPDSPPAPEPEPVPQKEPEQPEQDKDDSDASERPVTPDMVALVAAQYHAENHKDDPDKDSKLSWWGRLVRGFVEHLKKLDKVLNSW